jgi:hypothetical protein
MQRVLDSLTSSRTHRLLVSPPLLPDIAHISMAFKRLPLHHKANICHFGVCAWTVKCREEKTRGEARVYIRSPRPQDIMKLMSGSFEYKRRKAGGGKNMKVASAGFVPQNFQSLCV